MFPQEAKETAEKLVFYARRSRPEGVQMSDSYTYRAGVITKTSILAMSPQEAKKTQEKLVP